MPDLPTPAPMPSPAPQPAPAPASDPAPSPALAPAPGVDPAPGDPPAELDWRDRLAGDDKQFRKQLDRYSDLGAIGKKLRSLEGKLSSGEYKRDLPENASAEEVAAWRKENGIPQKAEDYVAKLALGEGMVLSEADKPVIAEFAAAALEGAIKPDQFNALVQTYYKIGDARKQQQELADAEYHDFSVAELQELWPGAEYKRNRQAVSDMMAGWPADLRDGVLAARAPLFDKAGKYLGDFKLGDVPAFVQQMATLARELNPAATLVPNTGGDPAKGVEDRIAELTKMMGKRDSDYWKGPKANALQQEFRELIDARDKMKARSA